MISFMFRESKIALPAFHKRLKRMRVAIGLKQGALAHDLGVTQTTISRWESGAQIPDIHTQERCFASLAKSRTEDSALKRLVESSRNCVHLVEEASHICLAYSKPRAKDWNNSTGALLGTSLWQFATCEIKAAEAQLETEGWWDQITPAPKAFETSEGIYPGFRVSSGGILWERIYLADGTPARLVSGIAITP